MIGVLIQLDHTWDEVRAYRKVENRRVASDHRKSPWGADLYVAVMEGAAERLRPKLMTAVAIMAGLLPIMWSTVTGSEVMSRIAAPMAGGMISSTMPTLMVTTAIYAIVKRWRFDAKA